METTVDRRKWFEGLDDLPDGSAEEPRWRPAWRWFAAALVVGLVLTLSVLWTAVSIVVWLHE